MTSFIDYLVKVVDDVEGGVEDDNERDEEADDHQVPGVRHVGRILPSWSTAVIEMVIDKNTAL